MSFMGHIENGVVVFDAPHSLPDGTPVHVDPVASPATGSETPLPHEPYLTQEINAPFDIPWPRGEIVVPIDLADYFPEPHDIPATE